MDSNTPTNDLQRGRGVPDLLFLSANFSSDSINEVDESSSSMNLTSAGYTRRYSGTHSGLLASQLAAQLAGQPSHTQTPRSSRARPRSAIGLESMRDAIWEHDTPDTLKRHSMHLGLAPPLNLVPHSYETPVRPPSPTRTYSGRPSSPTRTNALYSRSGSPVRTRSPVRGTAAYSRSGSPIRGTSPVRQMRSPGMPFNFTPQDIMMNHSNSSNLSLVVKPAHRKGHRYKHSSVSMNLFQEPLPIADANLQPDLIPDLYPIPNLRESLSSASNTQKYKLIIALVHLAVSVLVFVCGVHLGQASFLTLAHLVFYDSLGSLVVACVDIASNFEVWSKSSIAYPFGLGRLEVLVGFALSASLVMVGCDLVSHFVEELVVELVQADSVEHGPHHIHASDAEDVNMLAYEAVLLLVVAITWTSNYIFGNISRMMHTMDSVNEKLSLLAEKDPGMLGLVKEMASMLIRNPIRLLTLSYTLFLVLVPGIPKSMTEVVAFDISEVSTLVVAATLCMVGWNLVQTLGRILLISFPYSDYRYNVLRADVTDSIINLPSFKASYSIDHLFLTKVNYRLYIAGVGVTMKGGSADDESRLLFEINRIFNRSIQNFDKHCSVESTISVTRA